MLAVVVGWEVRLGEEVNVLLGDCAIDRIDWRGRGDINAGGRGLVGTGPGADTSARWRWEAGRRRRDAMVVYIGLRNGVLGVSLLDLTN